MTDPVRVAIVMLVDRRGWILLQERDEYARIAPEEWGFVGGHVEDGESFEAAPYRELEEETGIVWSSGLRLWREVHLDGPDRPYPAIGEFWVGATTLTDDDIVLGEGRQIVFVDPARVLELDLGGSARLLLPGFLASSAYQELRSASGP